MIIRERVHRAVTRLGLSETLAGRSRYWVPGGVEPCTRYSERYQAQGVTRPRPGWRCARTGAPRRTGSPPTKVTGQVQVQFMHVQDDLGEYWIFHL